MRTTRGAVRAPDVVLASHLPFVDGGFFFAKAPPSGSYALVAPIDPGDAPEGMFINTGQPTRSVRAVPDGERVLLLVGGEGHAPGTDSDTRRSYEALERFLREHWPRGQGAVVRVRGRQTAFYRDDAGVLHAFSPACTHLRCLVRWNTAERSWDCPCHGTRHRRARRGGSTVLAAADAPTTSNSYVRFASSMAARRPTAVLAG